MRGSSHTLGSLRQSYTGREDACRSHTHVWAITHTNGWNSEPLYSGGIPPVGRTEQGNLLVRGQFLDKVRDGCGQKFFRHLRTSTFEVGHWLEVNTKRQENCISPRRIPLHTYSLTTAEIRELRTQDAGKPRGLTLAAESDGDAVGLSEKAR